MNIATRPTSSRISGFHKMAPEERLALVESFAGLDPETKAQLAQPGNLDPHIADHMIENAIGTMSIPIGIAVNMKSRWARCPRADGDRRVLCRRRRLQFLPPMLRQWRLHHLHLR